jgi:GAF domain-containing protein
LTARPATSRAASPLLFVTNGLDEFLEQLAVLAADVVEGDSECGITLIRDGQPVTVAASGERTAKLDEIQYGNGDGPCLHAARTGEVVLVNDLSTDTRWPAYRDQVEGQGLHSTVALPLELGDDERGALNFYVFERRHRFTKGELRVLSQFSAEATRALDLACAMTSSPARPATCTPRWRRGASSTRRWDRHGPEPVQLR